MIAEDVVRLADATAEDVVRWTLDTFGARAAIVTAFQAEGMVALDLAVRVRPDVRVITIDTGRLPEQTYALMDTVRARYGVDVEVVFPNADDVERMVERHGVNLFFRDSVLRRLCCEVRKVLPLERAFQGLDAWITGLRRSQSDTRSATAKVQVDDAHGSIVKVNPIADWSSDRVWEYIEANDVPTNELYRAGYTSIGCAPCTRAVRSGEHERAGRWWWESDGTKECGIHERSPDERLKEELAWLKTQA